MAKAIVVVSHTQINDGNALIGYTVSVIQIAEPFSYGSHYSVNIAQGLAANLLAWRTKILAEIAERGVIAVASDVIVFGGPS